MILRALLRRRMKRLVHPSGKKLSESIKWNSFRNFVVLLAASICDMMCLGLKLDFITTKIPVFLSDRPVFLVWSNVLPCYWLKAAREIVFLFGAALCLRMLSWNRKLLCMLYAPVILRVECDKWSPVRDCPTVRESVKFTRDYGMLWEVVA